MAKTKNGGKLTTSSVGSSVNNLFLIDDETINNPVVRDKVFVPVIDGQPKGHGLVPRDYHKYPKEMFDPPTDIVLLTDDQIDAEIEEQERTQSSLQHLIDWPSLDQDGQGFCHTADTEVLTERGWTPWPDYNGSDLLGTMSRATGNLEFQSPLARQIFQYDGEMVHSTNRRIDFGVTPNHRMLVRKWDEARRTLSDSYSFVTAGSLGWYVGLPHATRGFVGTEFKRLAVEGDREYDGDDFLALLGLVTSDGYAGGTENTKNWVSFSSFREGTRPVIEALAARVGFHECPSRRGVWVRYDAGALANWLRANCYTGRGLGSENKRVPDVVKVASMRQIRHFLHYFDDRVRNGSQFFSTSKRMVDDLQELFLRVGKRSAIGWDEGKDVPFAGNAQGVIRSKGCYVLTVGEVDRLCLDRKKHLERDRYKGLVYCATVSNGTLVTRRNGSVLVSGNCWAYSVCGAIMAVRKIANQPYVRLSAHALACIIKGFKDEGGWCGLSAKGAREIGYPSVAAWPEKSMSRSNDTPAMRANAALHKVTEDWVDLTRDIYDQNLTLRQIDSLAVRNVPQAWDFNYWSHSVFGGRVVNVEKGSRGRVIRNSWTDNWGDKGWAVLRGNKAKPDGAVALRVAGASPN